MTREEAIRRMGCCRNFLANNYSDMGEPNFTAFNMAIDALKAEPCSDCISRQAALDALEKWWNCRSENDDIYEIIKAMPSVTPARKIGRWIMHIDDLFPVESTMECSECGEHQPITIDDNYCPNCGAKMVEQEESEGER